MAKRDAPQVAEKLWTHGMPKGPKGRFVSVLPRFQGLWNFSKNKSAAKSLLLHVSTREAAEKLVAACDGYDLPPYTKFNDFKTWEEVGPPKGTISHYPAKGDLVPDHSVRACPAVGRLRKSTRRRIVPKMVLRMAKGEPMDKTLDWAHSEVEGFFRN